MAEYFQSTSMIVHLAALLQVLALMLRDQIRLRVLLLAGSVLYTIYYAVHPATPLLDAMFWSALMALANGYMIVVLLRERRLGAMDVVEERIYDLLGQPLPGHFRRIMSSARKIDAAPGTQLTQRGIAPDRLYFVHHGICLIEIADGVLPLRDPGFIGEISLILRQGASATVTMPEGGSYLEWSHKDLKAMFDAHPPVRASFEALITRDLALKLKNYSGAAEMPSEAAV